MKLIAAVSALVLAAHAADVTFYNPEKNVTCVSSASSGDITCEAGHQSNAPEFSTAAVVSPAIRGRSPGLAKRLTCGISDRACFVNCFAHGYCNSNCDDNGICNCNCYDKSPWPLVCTKTTCS